MKCRYCDAYDKVIPNRTDNVVTVCPRDRPLHWRIKQVGVEQFAATSLDEGMRFMRGTGSGSVPIEPKAPGGYYSRNMYAGIKTQSSTSPSNASASSKLITV
jgi:hypothetical protein